MSQNQNPNQNPGQQQQGNQPGQKGGQQQGGGPARSPVSSSRRRAKARPAAGRQVSRARTANAPQHDDTEAPPQGGVFRLGGIDCVGLARGLAYAWPAMASSTLPLFHLYGDPPDDSGFRLHSYRDHRLALLGARLDDPRASPPQPVSDPADREGRRRDDLRDRDRAVRGAGGDPGAGRRPRTASASRRKSPTAGW